MTRQKEPVSYIELYFRAAYIQSRKGVEAFITLLQAQMVSVECLEVTQPIGSESWRSLAEAYTAEEVGLVGSISISRLGLGGAMAYMMGLWDSVGDGVVVFCPDSRIWEIRISTSDHVWYFAEQKLEMISTMTQTEFIDVVLLCEADGYGTTTESEEDDDEEEQEGDEESEEDEEESEEDDSEEEGGVDKDFDEDGQEEDHFGGEGDHGAV